MWRLVENSDAEKPLEVDETSSSHVVYVRRNFQEKVVLDEDGEYLKTVWQYMEKEIPKDQWESYQSILEAQQTITDLDLANLELQNEIEKLKEEKNGEGVTDYEQ